MYGDGVSRRIRIITMYDGSNIVKARALQCILLYAESLGSSIIVPLSGIATTCGQFGPNPKDETIVYYNACTMYI